MLDRRARNAGGRRDTKQSVARVHLPQRVGAVAEADGVAQLDLGAAGVTVAVGVWREVGGVHALCGGAEDQAEGAGVGHSSDGCRYSDRQVKQKQWG